MVYHGFSEMKTSSFQGFRELLSLQKLKNSVRNISLSAYISS